MTNATWDLWVDGTRVGTGLAKGGLGTDAISDSYAFNHQNSATSPGTIYIDDIEYSNTLPSFSSSSDIIANTSFTYPTNIAYSTYQGTSSLTTSNSVEVAKFDIRDGGASADADALSTILTAISFNVSNSSCLRRIAIFDGTNNISEVAGGSTASFSGLTLTAPDDGSKKFSIRVSFQASVTDNQQFSFTVTSATASASGSGFASTNAGGAFTSTAGDNNRIEVTASNLYFVVNPSDVSVNGTMTPSPTIIAKDGLNNTDLDFTGLVTLGTTGKFSGSAITSVNASGGTATFSNIIFSDPGNGITIDGNSQGLTGTGNSVAFNVTDPQPEINITQNSNNILSGDTYAFGSITSGTSSSTITFTIENLGAADLNLSGSPIIDIKGTNASEFSVDQSITNSNIGPGSNTTFTITFVPITQGSKTATISIANNDKTGSEDPYIIILTGTGVVTSSSDIIAKTGYIYTTNIPYANFQSPNTLTTVNSVGVFGVTMRDGGSSSDADNLATILTAISFSTGGSTAIRTAALFDGSTNLGEVAVNGGSTISFSGLLINAADNSTKDFELRVTYQSSVTDNQQMAFTVTSVTASTSGSGFATTNGGGSFSSTSGDNNRIEVTATKLAFVQQPTNTILGNNMAPAVTVSGVDDNNNLDLDFISSIDVTSTGTLSVSPQTSTAVSGVATFSAINHTMTGTGLTLTASSLSMTPATSNTFNITVQTAGLLLFEENFSYTSSTALTSNGWTAHSGAGTNPIQVYTSGLSYGNYGSTGIGNAAIVNANGEDVNKTFTQQESGSTVYYAFLVNVTSATTGGDYVLHLGPSTISTEFRGRFFIKSSSGNLLFGISSTGGTVNYAPGIYSFGTTYLIVIKHYFTTSTQTSSIFINPSTSTEPSTPDAIETSASTSTNIGCVALRQSNVSNNFLIDGIRVGTGWGAVLGNPQYSSSSIINAGNYNNVNLLSNDLTLNGDVNVNNILTVSSGKVFTAANTLTVNSLSLSSPSASKMIVLDDGTNIGTLKLKVSNNTVYQFPVGDTRSGADFTPATVTFTGTTFSLSYLALAMNAERESHNTSLSDYIKRNWTFTPTGLSNLGYTVSLKYTDADVNGTEANIWFGKYDNGSWSLLNQPDINNNLFTSGTLNSFSTFTGGEQGILPVHLSAFNSSSEKRNINLTWSTSSETNNAGFDIERKSVNDNGWVKTGHVNGNGTTNNVSRYSFTDRGLNSGKYNYRLKQIDYNGNYQYFDLNGAAEVGVPDKYNISQNYPNPFNPVTKIDIDIPFDSKVSLKLYDITGREIKSMLNTDMKAGYYTQLFDASSLSSGVYFYRVAMNSAKGNFSTSKKMMVIK
ncbi:MAG: choice-of-anchor D domain-containing protein [Bacteroidetes bacterium]|nr:choice-of-anchor D domain-containing protein [Bacteroidota bacterium]